MLVPVVVTRDGHGAQCPRPSMYSANATPSPQARAPAFGLGASSKWQLIPLVAGATTPSGTVPRPYGPVLSGLVPHAPSAPRFIPPTDPHLRALSSVFYAQAPSTGRVAPAQPGNLSARPRLVAVGIPMPSPASSTASGSVATPSEALGVRPKPAIKRRKLAAGKAPAELTPEQAVADLHRKPRRKSVSFASDKERAQFETSEQVETILPLLPAPVLECMLGGTLGMAQVPDPAHRAEMVRRNLAARGGLDGARLKGLRSMLCAVRSYAATSLRIVDMAAADAACFPMSSALVHTIVADAHAKATAKNAGSQGGQTVGNNIRENFIFASEKLGWPIEVPRAQIAAAAPKPKSLKRAKAGTLPIALKCQLEQLASGAPIPGIDPQSARVVIHYARSFLAAGLDQSVRIAEGVRVELWADETDPTTVMRGHAYMGKDGAPIDIYAPAEGILGQYKWYPAHLRACTESGQVFPAWKKKKGSNGDIAQAIDLTANVASKPDLRKAFKRLLQLPPLLLTDEELKEINVQGHSGHATPPDWGRAIGEQPNIPNLAPSLKVGFSDRDIDALGHWMRDANAKSEATASEAASNARPAGARRAAAIASLPGKGASAGAMRNYYGAAGASSSRVSERVTQLRVRQRLTHIVKAALAAKGLPWTELPRGRADLAILSEWPEPTDENGGTGGT